MKWYDDLYVGESIVHKTNKIKWKIRHNAIDSCPVAAIEVVDEESDE